MTRALEYSFKARVRNIAEERRIPPDKLWESLVLERFLVRLSKSPYANDFILKGGVLLSSYVHIGRHTQDLDFLVQQMSYGIDTLRGIVGEIINTTVDDGFRFSELTVRELAHPHMKSRGARASMMAFFGKTRFRVLIDLGYGDIVIPTRRIISLTSGSKGPLLEDEVEVVCYPQEFIFAEKLEAAVFLGAGNSRMKDFHDLYKLVSTDTLVPGVEGIVRAVFNHRGTPLLVPLQFDEAEWDRLRPHWSRHIRGLAAGHQMPRQLEVLVGNLNGWLRDNTSLCR